MKKRLLITSIVMMLVVAVALSTATYAWFTSNARVDATSMTLKASTSSATALGIGWAGGDAGTSIEANISGTLQPMAPDTLTPGTTKAGAGNGNITFGTATTKQESSVFVFNSDFTTESVTPITYENGTVSAFYVQNLSNANPIGSVTVSAVFGANGDNISGKGVTYAAATGDFNSNTTYYTKDGNVYTVAEGLDSATYNNNASGNYYIATEIEANALDGNDMVRVAIFTKEYKPATENYDSSKSYFEFSNNAFVAADVSGLSNGDSLAQKEFYLLDADYTLLGVMGSVATELTYANGLTAFAKNTTYYTVVASEAQHFDSSAAFQAVGKTLYTVSEGVYTKAASWTNASTDYYTLTASQVAADAEFSNEAKYYTAENTAVYGASEKFGQGDAVKDLDHYTDVTTNLKLTTDLLPQEKVEIIAIVWLDGTMLDDARQNDIGSVSLKFDA